MTKQDDFYFIMRIVRAYPESTAFELARGCGLDPIYVLGILFDAEIAGSVKRRLESGTLALHWTAVDGA